MAADDEGVVPSTGPVSWPAPAPPERMGWMSKIGLTLAHVSQPVAYITPVVVMIIAGDRRPVLRSHAAAAFDFQLTITFASTLLMFPFMWAPDPVPGLAILVSFLVVSVIWLWFGFRSIVAAWRGRPPVYPRWLLGLHRLSARGGGPALPGAPVT